MFWKFCDFIDLDLTWIRIDQILWIRIRIQPIRIHITGQRTFLVVISRIPKALIPLKETAKYCTGRTSNDRIISLGNCKTNFPGLGGLVDVNELCCYLPIIILVASSLNLAMLPFTRALCSSWFQSINYSINYSINQSINQSIINESTNQPTNQWINQSSNKSIINQSINQSMNQSIIHLNSI